MGAREADAATIHGIVAALRGGARGCPAPGVIVPPESFRP